ncbi:MAG TPA: GNAT family N-acetyltransferase [Bryobacteraceae bacterium]|nr:GNAT family N-acetyltransferase [Bryobacteraceae bacterium]
MLFGGAALARRIEAAEAANAVGCTAAQAGAAVLEVGGGRALFAGKDSPLTHAVGMGLNGPVQEGEIDGMEDFFHSRKAKVTMDLCPLADAGFLQSLARRGYRATEFNNVMVKVMAGVEIVMTPRVRPALALEADRWAHTVGCGFFEQPELTTEEMDVGRAIFQTPEAICYLAAAESGELAAGAALSIRNGLAMLFADSTIPRFRRGGFQRELITARLNEAVAQGCDLATSSVFPGSGSQRNYERMGFQVIYTRFTLTEAANS